MEKELSSIKAWLGTGSINIFGLPMSGKDTVGTRLATALDAKFISSGDILRQAKLPILDTGALAPIDQFRDIVLPYFYRPELAQHPLILSAVGRWDDEKSSVINTAQESGHPICAVILLDITEQEAWKRWHSVKASDDRGHRGDDTDEAIFTHRLTEFREKTLPTINYYKQHFPFLTINAAQSRDTVFARVIDQLSIHALKRD